MKLSKSINENEKELLRLLDFFLNEAQYKKDYKIIVGVDEVGRGPLAGPVYAACVCLKYDLNLTNLNDSKKLSENKREVLEEKIKESSYFYTYGFASVEEIDKYNILNATMLAMKRAVDKCPITPDLVLVDGNKTPDWDYNSISIIKGDQNYPSIAAASILAKTKRDKLMTIIQKFDNNFNYSKHKGYGTKEHYQELNKNGPSILHRRTFIKDYI
ncbi:MAG: ribonuclease HII [Firmicutes bacterium]|nr:ribonuclease HII [Bacillota bacterium]